jgi:hypothetical protein
LVGDSQGQSNRGEGPCRDSRVAFVSIEQASPGTSVRQVLLPNRVVEFAFGSRLPRSLPEASIVLRPWPCSRIKPKYPGCGDPAISNGPCDELFECSFRRGRNRQGLYLHLSGDEDGESFAWQFDGQIDVSVMKEIRDIVIERDGNILPSVRLV